MYTKLDSTKVIQYRLGGRKPSCATLAKPDTNEQSNFTKTMTVFMNENSLIRLFNNPAGEALIVKSPQAVLQKSSYKTQGEFEAAVEYELEDLKAELFLWQKAYPNEAPYSLHILNYPVLDDIIWSYRLLIPYISGPTLDEFASQYHKDMTWLLFFTAIAREIKRINDNGILHGDIKGANAMVVENDDSFHIHFVDFGCAYLMTEEEAVCTKESGDRASYWAPERRGDAPKLAKPDIKQDVYSFGHMILGYTRKRAYSFAGAYPTIFAQLGKTQERDPALRPNLEEIFPSLKP